MGHLIRAAIANGHKPGITKPGGTGQRDLRHQILAGHIRTPQPEQARLGRGFAPGTIHPQIDHIGGGWQDLI